MISGCGTCTEKSFWTPIYIKRLVPEISSYIRDTKHFLQTLRYLGRLPEGTISGCSGLYPHIPREEGLQALREALTNSPDDLARLALTNNNLSLVENITYNSGEMLSVLNIFKHFHGEGGIGIAGTIPWLRNLCSGVDLKA